MGILSASSRLVLSNSPDNNSAATPDTPRLHSADQSDWRTSLRSAIRDVGELCQLLKLSPDFAAQATAAAADFSVFVPREFMARMEPSNPDDPLLRQVLPVAAEMLQPPGFLHDPLAESAATIHAGTVQKYARRALLVMTGTCAVHCRYCFRRHFPYESRPAGAEEWQLSLDSLAEDASLEEVLLSGGDPLTLTDEYLAGFLPRLDAIAQLRRLRIHTRLPIMIPSRVTDELLQLFHDSRLTTIMVLHVNHAQEIDESVALAIAQLVDNGIPLLNQAVLLHGVNDNVDSLVELSRRLIDLRVMPYYLHQLDRVTGAAHFEVPVEQGKRMVESMRARLPGYAVPRYVEEKPGEPHKSVLA